jgi:hypothetical protein
MMNRRYWAEIDGERIYRASLDAVKRIAQDTADKLGRVVRVGYEDRPAARRNPTPPIKRHAGRVIGFAFVDAHRGKVIARTMRPALRQEDRDYAAEKGLSIRPLYEGDFYKANPAAKPAKRRQRVGGPSPKLAYFAGVMAARDGQARSSNPHYGAEAKAWREGFDYVVKHYRANPLALDLPDYAQAKDRARRGRLNFLAATKARRLAKGLRGRDRGGAVKAAERRAEKTAKFAVKVRGGVVNGVAQPPMTLYRASRASAEAIGAAFEAAGCKVTIAPV